MGSSFGFPTNEDYFVGDWIYPLTLSSVVGRNFWVIDDIISHYGWKFLEHLF